MKDLYKLIKEISETKARTGKEKIIKRGLEEHDLFASVLDSAYNSFITYGIKGDKLNKVPDLELTDVPFELITEFYELLDDLSSRALTGSAARTAVDNFKATHPIMEFILNAVLNKDLRCGISVKTVNKAAGQELIAVFDVMLAHPYEASRVNQWPVIVEPKIDGMRCIARYMDGKVEFLSRNGLPITAIPHLESAISELFSDNETKYVDGELTAGENFNISISALRKKTDIAENVQFNVFNILTEDEFMGRADTTFDEHVKRLNSFNVQLPLQAMSVYEAQDDAEVQALYGKARERGEEGIIVKEKEGSYVPKRSYSWMKIKAKETDDLEIIGCYEGEGKYTGQLGGFTAMFEGVEVRVGGGFSDKQRDDFYRDIESITGSVMEVEYHEVTPDGSLRHARFKGFREDKD